MTVRKSKKLETPFAKSRLNRKSEEISFELDENIGTKTTEFTMDSCHNYDECTVNGKKVVDKVPLSLFQFSS